MADGGCSHLAPTWRGPAAAPWPAIPGCPPSRLQPEQQTSYPQSMPKVLVTGMSGTGTSAALQMMTQRGHRVAPQTWRFVEGGSCSMARDPAGWMPGRLEFLVLQAENCLVRMSPTDQEGPPLYLPGFTPA